MTDEKLETTITQNGITNRTQIRVNIRSDGSHERTFDQLREAVNAVLDDDREVLVRDVE